MVDLSGLNSFVSSKAKESSFSEFDLFYVLASEFGYSEQDIVGSSIPFLLGVYFKHGEFLRAQKKEMDKAKKGKGV